ncbi:YdaU family protein [Oryzomonas sagensis]|uniref:YdaU family protein n=1 Tax=Oryzomonas sagensis TaxID=2603857 RepID=A0ABQ6TM38_9BACT|nr:DUF1376 domain-containing protein [Oryzomonas sagensis]KAB0669290.1 YdaU family protein [Oryzomonas sagensis]
MARKPYDYPYYPRNPGDFFEDPRFTRLPGLVRGTFGNLLDLIWHKGFEAQLSDDDDEISLWLNLDKGTWIDHKEQIMASGLLKVDPDMKRIYNNRLIAEYGITRHRCEQNSRNRRGAKEKAADGEDDKGDS